MSFPRDWIAGLDEIRLHPDVGGVSQATLSEILENVPLAICVTLGPEHRYAFANKLFRSALQISENLVGTPLREALGDRYNARTQSPRETVLETGKPTEITSISFGQGSVEDPTYWDIKFLPVRDAEDRVTGVLSLGIDVTLRVKATSEADRQAQAMLLNNERLALAVEATELGLWDWTAATNKIYWSDRQREIFGVTADVPLTHELWESSIHPEDREWVTRTVERLIDPASDGRLQLEYRIVLPNGDIRWISSRGRMVYERMDGELQAARLLGTILDITERRTNEEARRLLAKELDHRVKNLFAMASAMVTMTARTAASPADMASSLHGRLQALAKAHELIRPALAEEALHHSETSVAAIIETILAPHHDLCLPGRILMDCAPTSVGARSATSLTLVLHELATNASKYGALSTTNGHLTISCWHDGEAMFLSWQERGGPEIDGPPKTKGFGSQLAQKSVADQLEGMIAYDWQRGGLRVELRVPLAHLSR